MEIVPVVEVIESEDSPPSTKKEISTSPTHPLVPTVIQPDGTIADSRRPSIIYPRPSSSRSHREREKHRGSRDHIRRSHEVIRSPTDELEGEFGSAICLRPRELGVRGYSPQRRLTLADALVPRSGRSTNSSSPRRHSAADTDNSDVQADLTLEALLVAGSRRNSLRVEDRLSRRSSRSSRSSSRRRSSSTRRPRKISTASAISGVDRYSCNDGSSVPSRFSCHEEEEDEPEEVLRKRAKIARIIGSVAASIFLGAILLVALTLSMAPTIDEMVRKENEEILQKWQADPTAENASTSPAPDTDVPSPSNATFLDVTFPDVTRTSGGRKRRYSNSRKKKRFSASIKGKGFQTSNRDRLGLPFSGEGMSKYKYKRIKPGSKMMNFEPVASASSHGRGHVMRDKLSFGKYSLLSSNNLNKTGSSRSKSLFGGRLHVVGKQVLNPTTNFHHNSSVSKNK